MSDSPNMAPDDSPGTLDTRSGVRRVNNLPIYILGGVVGTFLLVMSVVASSRAAKQAEPGVSAPPKAGNSNLFAQQIAGDQTGGLVPPAKQAAKSLLIVDVDSQDLAQVQPVE